ncbi:TPA: tail fiber protein [Serratia marcescens]
MIIGFGNNVVSSLAADITAAQTTIQVMPGAGALFAGLLTYDYANDSNPLKVYAKITLTDAKETVFEVCHLTAVNNDMLTVVRGQEGSAAKGWSLNDVIANFATRGSENQFVQIEQLQSGHYTSAVAGGTANGLTLALPATFFLNGSTEWALKTPILIYPTLNNTGASTLQLTMGGRVMGTYPLVKGSNTALRAGDIVAKNPFLAVFNADQGRFIVLNPTTDVGSVRSVNTHEPDANGNVKLGTAADADIGTDAGNVMAVGAFGLGAGPIHRADAYGNIAEFFRVNSTSANRPGSNSAYGCVRLPIDGAPTAAYLAVGGDLSTWVGQSTTQGKGVTWARVYTTAYKPTAADVNAVAKAGDTMTGQLIAPAVATTPEAIPWGAGAYADQLSTQAPFFQPNWQWPVSSGGLFVPIAKGTSTRKDRGYPGAVSFGYLMPANDEHPHPTIHMKGDSNVDTAWDFNPYSGGISSKAGTFATQEWVNANTFNGGNHPTQASVSGNQWWYKDLCTGMIFQGGYAEGQNGNARDRIALNISVPNRLLYVSTIIRNYGQGYDTTYNPQVGDLTGERDGFWWFHGAQERIIYWMAVGY